MPGAAARPERPHQRDGVPPWDQGHVGPALLEGRADLGDVEAPEPFAVHALARPRRRAGCGIGSPRRAACPTETPRRTPRLAGRRWARSRTGPSDPPRGTARRCGETRARSTARGASARRSGGSGDDSRSSTGRRGPGRAPSHVLQGRRQPSGQGGGGELFEACGGSLTPPPYPLASPPARLAHRRSISADSSPQMASTRDSARSASVYVITRAIEGRAARRRISTTLLSPWWMARIGRPTGVRGRACSPCSATRCCPAGGSRSPGPGP